MSSAIQLLINKYPALQYFNILDIITEEQLQSITPELSLPLSQMSPSAKAIFKQIRNYASAAEQKFKQSRNLYRTLNTTTSAIDSIILNNSNLKSIQALERKPLDNLVQLQLSSNQIRSLSPLKRMQAANLQELDLSSNRIESLLPLNEISWARLKYLNLNHNSINSIEGIRFGYFPSLKKLDLSDNFILSVRSLRKELHGSMRQLKSIDLSSNQIFELGWLSECFLSRLEKLDLRNNRYGSLSGLEKVKMGQGEQGSAIYSSNYQIQVSWWAGESSGYMVGYRSNSGHKLAIRVDTYVGRSRRENVQKSRKLILC